MNPLQPVSRRHAVHAATLVACLSLAGITTAQVIEVPPDTAPASIGIGETLNLRDGGLLPEFFTVESGGVLNVFGGEIDGPFALNGGFFGFAGSEINFFAGETRGAEYGTSGVLNLFGGNPGDFALFDPGSVVNIFGGDTGFNATIAGTVNLRGGVLQNSFLGTDSGVLNIFGRSLEIDGAPVTSLLPDTPLLIEDRGVTLSGVLADRTPFEFDLILAPGLSLTPGLVASGFTTNFILTVPEPSTALLALASCLGLTHRRRRG